MDIVLLINEYLKDKAELRDFENDSFNIVDNQIHSWSFTNIPQPSTEQLLSYQQNAIDAQDIEIKLKNIEALELQITPRRIREAIISGDNSFIQSIENQINAIRLTLV